MRPHIEKIVNVKGDNNCGFREVARHMGMDEESHPMVRIALILELQAHKSDYMPILGSEERFNYIMNDLYLPKNSSGIA